jgi:lipid-A-disaccharide synthase
VVVYRVSVLTYLIVKMLIKVPYIGLINIVGRKRIVPEYIQFSIRVPHIAREVLRLIKEPDYAVKIIDELHRVRDMLGGRGASSRAADVIVRSLRGAEQGEKG